MDILLGSLNEGFLWAMLAIGVFITFRQLDFPDLTVEGSFATGGAVVAILVTKSVDPFVSTLIAFIAGGLAGLITGLLHTKLKIPPILAGILTMTALYSINMHIMGQKSNIGVTGFNTIISLIQKWFHIEKIYSTLIVGILFAIILCGALYWFFGTQYGSSLRATGINEKMARAQGINTDSRKICGLMISNAIVALSGAMVAQSSNYADVTMGVGAIVVGLASVIIGETLFAKARSFWMRLISIVVGSIIYKMIVALVISIDGFNASDIKLITAVIIALALALPTIKSYTKRSIAKSKNKKMLAGGNGVGGSGGTNIMTDQIEDLHKMTDCQQPQCVDGVQQLNNGGQIEGQGSINILQNNEVNNVAYSSAEKQNSFSILLCKIKAKMIAFTKKTKDIFKKKEKPCDGQNIENVKNIEDVVACDNDKEKKGDDKNA